MADQYVDLTVCGVMVPRMKVMPAQYKGRCNNTGTWFDPEKEPRTIAFKHRDHLTDDQKKAIFGDGKVYHVTVLLDQAPTTAVVPTTWTPSKYQSHILDRLLNTVKHLFIMALAGSGKTATLVWLVQELCRLALLKSKRVVYLAFNKSIQEELSKKLLGTGCPAMTTHSFGFQLLKQAFKELERAAKSAIQNSKTGDLFIQLLAGTLFGDLSPLALKKAKKSDHYDCRKPVLSLVGFIKNWAICPALTDDGYVFSTEQKTRIMEFFVDYQISVPDDFTKEQLVDYACAVTAMSIPLPGEILTRITFDDMLYLPLALGLTFPKYNLVLTDESQDFNEAQEQFLCKLIEKGARCCVVGDPGQSVYRFRSADSKAFIKIKEMLEKTQAGVEVCDLPVNYRSDVAIINHAKQWVDKLEGRGSLLGQQQGEVVFTTTYSQALQWSNNDGEEEFCYLCRINVPLVVTAYQLIAQGKRVCIIGRQAIASPMISIIEDLCGKVDKAGNKPDYYTNRITDRRDNDGKVIEEGLLSRLAHYYNSQVSKLTEEKHEQVLEDLTNNVDCIEIIAGRVKEDSVTAVIQEIDNLFVEKPDDRATIKLSTVHRAKGLEWDTVLVLCPHLMPHPNVRPNPDGSWSEDEQQEQNLQYICATRARHKLHYICNWPFGRGKGQRMAPTSVDAPSPRVNVPREIPKTPDFNAPKEMPKPIIAQPEAVKFVDDGEPF